MDAPKPTLPPSDLDFFKKRAAQSLDREIPMLPRAKPMRPRMPCSGKAPWLIAESPAELDRVRKALRSRLGKVVRDMFEFRDVMPEFREILDFLLPWAQRWAQEPKREKWTTHDKGVRTNESGFRARRGAGPAAKIAAEEEGEGADKAEAQ
jgi:hypothetical protein